MTVDLTDPREALLKGNRCHCTNCNEYFTSPWSFDLHQRLAKDGSVICTPPGDLVDRKTGGPRLKLNEFGYWRSATENPRFTVPEAVESTEGVKGG